MAFESSRFTRATLAFNAGAVVVDGPATVNGPTVFTYQSATDNLATISGANYFADVVYDIAVGDVIITNGSDASSMYIVATVNRSAGTVTVNSFTASGSVGTANIQNDAVTTAKILNANVTLAKLASGIAPSHVVKFADQETTVGGAAAEAFTVTGVAATDLAFVQIVNNGTNNVTALQAVCTLNTLTVTFSADPGADTVFNYQILRAAS
jgi:hypothetical protein